MATVSTLRGEDSTGAILGWRKRNKQRKIRVNYRKEVTNPVSFMRHPDTLHMMNSNDLFMFLGHARAATMGKVNIQNAHPIEEGNIIGTHNGTINAFRPPSRLEDVHSDSREFFRRINEKGLQKAVLEANDGAFAIAYVDRASNRFFLCRNKHRPLFIMHAKNNLRFFYASEKWMLETVRNRLGEWGKYHEPESLQEGLVVSFQLGTMLGKEENITLKENTIHWIRTYESPEVPKIEYKNEKKAEDAEVEDQGEFSLLVRKMQEEAAPCDYWGDTPFKDDDEDPENETEEENARRANAEILKAERKMRTEEILSFSQETPKVRTISVEKNGDRKIYRFYKYFENRVVSLSKAEKLLEKGCEISGQVADVDQEVIWIGPTSYILPEMRDTEIFREYCEGVCREDRSKLL